MMRRFAFLLASCALLSGCWYTPGDGSFNEALDNALARGFSQPSPTVIYVVPERHYYGHRR